MRLHGKDYAMQSLYIILLSAIYFLSTTELYARSSWVDGDEIVSLGRYKTGSKCNMCLHGKDYAM